MAPNIDDINVDEIKDIPEIEDINFDPTLPIHKVTIMAGEEPVYETIMPGDKGA